MLKKQQQFLTKTIGTFGTKEIGKRFSRFLIFLLCQYNYLLLFAYNIIHMKWRVAAVCVARRILLAPIILQKHTHILYRMTLIYVLYT